MWWSGASGVGRPSCSLSKNRSTRGGYGKLEYRVLDARNQANVAHLNRLLHLAFYTGIGYKTTHGLGQVRLLPLVTEEDFDE